jgi:hypothetical protein
VVTTLCLDFALFSKSKKKKNGGRGRGESGSFKGGGSHCAQFASMDFPGVEGRIQVKL